MTVMVIAPHPDDDILGVGGTIAKYANRGDEVICCVVTNGSLSEKYTDEYVATNRLEYRWALEELGDIHSVFLEFPTPTLDTVPQANLNDELAKLIKQWKPEEVYIPHWGDIHKEHQIVCQSALVATRPPCSVKRIYSYEVPSETGWSEPTGSRAFIPNVYIDVARTIGAKIKAMKSFEQQLQPNPLPRSIKAIMGLASYRGSQIGIEYAEAFELIREVK